MIPKLLLIAALGTPWLGHAAEYRGVRLLSDKTQLIITKSDGSEIKAPKFDDQTEFESPQVSKDGRYVGWLAEYPNRGASYAQPLHLVVADRNNRLHRFAGDFGMVFRWCFWPKASAVVYAFSFPHGLGSTGFEMRRIEDERVLATYDIPDDSPAASSALKNAPAWVKCISQWQNR